MSAAELPKVVVTGIAGRLGRQVAQRLHRLGRYRVVGIDRRPLQRAAKDIEHLQVDLRSSRTQDVFRGGSVAAVVHLGVKHDPRTSETRAHHTFNVVGTSRLLEWALQYKVPKVVVLSSADVYGPRPDNQQYLTEDAPLMGAAEFPSIRDLVEVDMLASSFFWRSRGSEVETVVLRPVHILGAVSNAASNYLRLKRIPTVIGYDPMVQVIHQADVVDALIAALEPGVHGVFNITGPPPAPLSVILRETRRPLIPLPGAMFRVGLAVAWKLRLSAFPPPELSHISFVGMVDGARAEREMGFVARHSLSESIEAVYQIDPLDPLSTAATDRDCSGLSDRPPPGTPPARRH